MSVTNAKKRLQTLQKQLSYLGRISIIQQINLQKEIHLLEEAIDSFQDVSNHQNPLPRDKKKSSGIEEQLDLFS